MARSSAVCTFLGVNSAFGEMKVTVPWMPAPPASVKSVAVWLISEPLAESCFTSSSLRTMIAMRMALIERMRWALVALTGAIAVFVGIWMLREKAMADVAALALILGGALGNIRDRFYHGFVIDYADLHFGDFRPFLIFNVADAAITIGVLIILARTLLSREKPEAEADTIASET